MRGTYAVFHREFFGYFRSPIGYVFLLAFAYLAIGLPWFLDNFLESDEASLQGFFRFLPWVNALFIPAVGMRLWSEEKNSGTIELLLTMPVSLGQAVAGKFLAGCAFIAVGYLLTGGLAATIGYLGQPDWGVVCGGYAMGLLMAASVLAISSFASALTRSQVVAFAVGLSGCLTLNLTGWGAFASLLRDAPVGAGEAVSTFSFISHFEMGRQGVIRLQDLLFFSGVCFSGLAAAAIALDRAPVGKRLLQIAAVGVCLGLFADVLSHVDGPEIDLTREQLFTLSTGSRQFAEHLERPTEIELYFSDSERSLPVGLRFFAHRVEALLRQYERCGNGQIRVSVIDPLPGSAAEEEANRLGIARQPIGAGARLYFGIAVLQGANRRTLPLVDVRRERLLETDITQLLFAVQQPRLPKLAVVSSLQVFGQRGLPKRLQKVEDGTAEWQFVQDLRASFEVAEVVPDAATLPSDTECLLLINPAGIDPRLEHAIDQFVLSGRPAVVLADPYCDAEAGRRASAGNVIGDTYYLSGFAPELLSHWGIAIAEGRIEGDLGYATDVPLAADGALVHFPLWPTITSFDDGQSVVAGLDRVTLAYAGALQVLPLPGVRVTPLIRSSGRSGTVDTEQIGRVDPRRFANLIHPTGDASIFAAELDGVFTTAYPGGRPPAPAGRPDAADADPWDLRLKQSATQSRVIVVGDADFLDNGIAYELVGRSGAHLITRPRNDNVAFLERCLQRLIGNLGQSGILPKAPAVRPFTRFQALRTSLESAYAREAGEVDSRLEQLSQEGIALNRSAEESAGSQLGQATLTALRQIDREQAALKAQRLEMDERLQRAVRAEGRKLTLFNFALPPMALALVGLTALLSRVQKGGDS